MRERIYYILITFFLLNFLLIPFFPFFFRQDDIFSNKISYKDDLFLSNSEEIVALVIDDNNPTINWTVTNNTYEWCNGAGTITNPYVIKNVTFSGGGTDHCIRIRNSENYFVIKNCTFYNSGSSNAGITLDHTDNGRLINNTLRDNSHGIYFYLECDNNYVFDNIILNCGVNGIYINVGSDYNEISGNYLENCENIGISCDFANYNTIYENILINCEDSISLWNTHNNTISNNNISNAHESCLSMHDYCYSNKILENNIIDCEHWITVGISVYLHCSDNEINNNNIINCSNGISISNNCSDNKIYNNLIFYSVHDYDIILRNDCDSNTFLNNTIVSYSDQGVYIQTNDCEYNHFYLNNLSQNAIDNGSSNYWNNSAIGNYWGDYPSIDANDDGIGDDPYYINGSAGSIDYFPIWIDPPYFVINSPEPNVLFKSIPPFLNVSIIHGNVSTMWYILNNSGSVIIFTGNTTIDLKVWNAIEDGTIKIQVFMNDTMGYIGSKDVLVQKDTIAPTSSIFFIPYSGTNVVEISTLFILTAHDGENGSGISVIRYKINNSNWIDYSVPFSLIGFEFGDYIISYNAIDAAGNIEEVNTRLVKLVESKIIPSYDMLLIFIITISLIGSGVSIVVIVAVILKGRRK